MRFDTENLTFGTWHSTLDTHYLILETWHWKLDIWYSVLNTWHFTLETRNSTHDTWPSALNTSHSTLNNRHFKKKIKNPLLKYWGNNFRRKSEINYRKQFSTKISTYIICRFWIVQRRYWMGEIHQNFLWNPRISCTRGENLYIKIII